MAGKNGGFVPSRNYLWFSFYTCKDRNYLKDFPHISFFLKWEMVWEGLARPFPEEFQEGVVVAKKGLCRFVKLLEIHHEDLHIAGHLIQGLGFETRPVA